MLKQHFAKLAAASATALVSVGMLASSAFASSVTVFNTGNNFHLTSNTSTTTTVTVVNNNTAHINQFALNFVDTGHNMANRNIFGGSITTGNASVSNMFFASANTNFTSISF